MEAWALTAEARSAHPEQVSGRHCGGDRSDDPYKPAAVRSIRARRSVVNGDLGGRPRGSIATHVGLRRSSGQDAAASRPLCVSNQRPSRSESPDIARSTASVVRSQPRRTALLKRSELAGWRWPSLDTTNLLLLMLWTAGLALAAAGVVATVKRLPLEPTPSPSAGLDGAAGSVSGE